MTFKSKLYALIATTQDYMGMHGTAKEYRKTNPKDNIETFLLLLGIPLFPIMYIIFTIIQFKFHKPNCDCEQYKQLYGE